MERKREIKIQKPKKPKKFSEKISKKNPAIKPNTIPDFSSFASKMLAKIKVIKTRFGTKLKK